LFAKAGSPAAPAKELLVGELFNIAGYRGSGKKQGALHSGRKIVWGG
jgi:hypothetical protein